MQFSPGGRRRLKRRASDLHRSVAAAPNLGATPPAPASTKGGSRQMVERWAPWILVFIKLY